MFQQMPGQLKQSATKSLKDDPKLKPKADLDPSPSKCY